MNPEKMRGEYGKLAYLLQDAVSPAIKQDLGFSVVAGIRTGEATRGLPLRHLFSNPTGQSRHQMEIGSYAPPNGVVS
jgi:hypothetical protein